MLLLRDELILMAKSDELSSMEAEAIVQVAKDARFREAYNRLYAQTISMARNG
jgi:hypothetical protein